MNSFYIDRQERKTILWIVDMLLLLVAELVWLNVFVENVPYAFMLKAAVFNVVVYSSIGGFLGFFDDFTFEHLSLMMFRQFIGLSLQVVLFYLVYNVVFHNDRSLYWIIPPFAIFYTLTLFWRGFYKYAIFRKLKKNVLIVGAGDAGKLVVDAYMEGRINKKDYQNNLVGFVDDNVPVGATYKDVEVLGTCDDVLKLSQRYGVHEIVFAIKQTERMREEIATSLIKATENGVLISNVFSKYEEILQKLPVEKVGNDFYHFFPFSSIGSNIFYRVFIRFLEIFFALIGAVVLFLFIPIIWVLNLFWSRGPIFYSQSRVGLNGKEFKITKLRSMVVDAEKSGAQWSSNNDARITKIGKFLRKSRLDELPQVFALLRGDMALIGPRPERQVFIDDLRTKIPFYEARHYVKPGITGWAQVKYKYGNTVHDSLMKLQYDLYYIKNQSVLLDVIIIFKTVSTVLKTKGQ